MGRRGIAWLLLSAGCGPVVTADDGDTSSTSGTSATTSGDPTTANPTTATPSTTEDPTTPTSLSTSGNPTTATDPATTEPGTTIDPDTGDTCAFLCPPDVIIEPLFCDVWAQDCFRGEKCMPWANDGGSFWNDEKCSPIADDPGQPGDPCTARGSSVTGIDDCDSGSMCFFVDHDTNVGTCVSFCMGNEDNPICQDPATICASEFDGVLPLCLPACDPLLQDCERGGCYATPDRDFACAPTFGIGLGAGQTCGHEWECAPGYTCHDGTEVPDCVGERCCAPLCDITVPGQCEELTCEAWFIEGQSPGQDPPYGVCVLE
jgi:hypothetical protein